MSTNVVVLQMSVGNSISVFNALSRIHNSITISNDPEAIVQASHLIVPGVGSFGFFMESLVKEDLIEPIKAFISSGKPYLGICLGMQILYESSEESPLVGGIGKFSGKVNKFSHKSNSMLTHNGWNEIAKVSDRDDVLGISDKSSFYFNHSYFVSSTGSEVRAVTRNGDQFPSIVIRDNVIGVQFHPEKSQENGTKFISRFLKL